MDESNIDLFYSTLEEMKGMLSIDDYDLFIKWMTELNMKEFLNQYTSEIIIFFAKISIHLCPIILQHPFNSQYPALSQVNQDNMYILILRNLLEIYLKMGKQLNEQQIAMLFYVFQKRNIIRSDIDGMIFRYNNLNEKTMTDFHVQWISTNNSLPNGSIFNPILPPGISSFSKVSDQRLHGWSTTILLHTEKTIKDNLKQINSTVIPIDFTEWDPYGIRAPVTSADLAGFTGPTGPNYVYFDGDAEVMCLAFKLVKSNVLWKEWEMEDSDIDFTNQIQWVPHEVLRDTIQIYLEC